MIDFSGAGNKLKTLLDRLTELRAVRLDYLDTWISTRAPASTAVSNATYTTPRATALGNAIQTSVLNSNIQSGYISYATWSAGTEPDEANYIDITVASVANWNTKTLVLITTSFRNASDGNIIGRMTSATNLRVSSVNPARGRWQIIEFK